VEILRRGDEIVMREAPVIAAAIFDVLAELPVDFMCSDREDLPHCYRFRHYRSPQK
jgi:antitoxin VapB